MECRPRPRDEPDTSVQRNSAASGYYARHASARQRPDSGEVIFEGKPVLADERGVRTIRRRMGMVFQNFELFPHLTALSNVSRGPRTVFGWKRASAEAVALELLRSQS